MEQKLGPKQINTSRLMAAQMRLFKKYGRKNLTRSLGIRNKKKYREFRYE
jgi:hypothetical protein